MGKNENIAKQPNKINEAYVGVYAYDMAIVEDLRVRFNHTKDGKPKTNNIVQITNSENVFNIIGDIANDAIQFPLISLTRTDWHLEDQEPHFMTKAGGLVGYLEDEPGRRMRQVRLQAIPIQINYQLDIWTQNRIDNDVIAREIIWFYKLNPQLLVKIPHGLNITHPFNIGIENEIVDNSDLAEHNSRGRYYRQTLGIYTNKDAYLWRTSVTDVPVIDIDSKFAIYDGEIDKLEDLIAEEEMPNLVIPDAFVEQEEEIIIDD